MKIVFSVLILIHGLLHFMGFARVFAIGNAQVFSKEPSKPIGLIWLLTGLLFLGSAIMMLLKKEGWPVLAILAAIVSQIVIFAIWSDAKYGTMANVIILIVAVIALGTERFENSYKNDVESAMRSSPINDELITEEDLTPLPPMVQRYLKYVGVVGKPKVHTFRIVFEGEMRDKGKDWFSFTSEQYNFIKEPTRLFFMKAQVKGLPTHGYHYYQKEDARMQIKLLSLFSVVDVSREDLYTAETVTFFNDLCLFAPAALIDNRIQWENLDETSVMATFINKATKISAILYFNDDGQLINFVSKDRVAVSEMKTLPFSTPIKNYRNVNGYMLPTYGEAIWHYPEGQFIYGRFNVKSIQYNLSDLQE